MHTLLVSPISPGRIGNGLAHRARQWELALRSCSDSRTLVVPVAGLADESRGDLVVAPSFEPSVDVPRLARGCTVDLGRQAGASMGPIDVIVVLRSYLGQVGLGLADATGATVLLDLDDDDVDFFRQEGNDVEAERFERWIAALRTKCDRVVSVQGSSTDAAVPNSVDIPIAGRNPATPPRVLLVGNFRYGPNLTGAGWFLDSVMPLVRERRPDVAVDFVGPASEQFGSDGCGVVQDLDAMYRKASVAVVPILTGSGTRIKALEAWAHGVPVVSTSVGIDGLGAIDGTDVLIADEPARFATAILTLLADTEWAERIGTAGRRRAVETFDASSVRKHMVRLVESMVGLGRWLAVPLPGMELTPTPDGLVVYDPTTQKVHHLNQSAMAVYTMADGTLTDAEIASEIAEIYELDTPPYESVAEAMSSLIGSGLLVRRRV